jgi:hypothetical protein
MTEPDDKTIERMRADLFGLSGGDFAATPGEARAIIVSVQAALAAQGAARIDPMQDPMRPTLAKLGPSDEHPAEEVLRKLACWLGVGGYNAPTVDADLFHRKIVAGIEDLRKNAAQGAEPVASKWLGPCKDGAQALDELRRACAEIIGADPETWPTHGNAPLAIAAALGLRQAELNKLAAQPTAGWIACSEQMPEPGELVLVSDGINVDTGEFDPLVESDGYWWVDVTSFVDPRQIAHWQPLPPLPTAKDE